MSAPPAWLFSKNSDDAAAAATPATADPKTTADRPSTRTMGKKGGSTAVAAPTVPALLMDIVEKFLKDHAFTDAHKAFRAQRKEKGLATKDKDAAAAAPTLVEVFASWQKAAAKSDEDSSDSSDSSESSDSSDGDDSDSSDEEEAPKKQEATKSLKRKAPESDSDSSEVDSDSDSDSSDGSDDEEEDKEKKPQAKKQKTKTAIKQEESDNKMDVDSASDSDSDSSDSDSDSDSESDSESDSDSDSSDSEVEKAAAVALPASDSSSSDSASDSSSDSDSSSSSEDETKPKTKKVKKEKAKKDSSDSSVTLDRASPVAEPPLPPAPAAKRKQNEPFSRIPKNIKVEARFASNEWVPMDYSQRAHEDLIVTKGKGFTKAKNKMKKGSFRGGVIDITEKKAVYFED